MSPPERPGHGPRLRPEILKDSGKADTTSLHPAAAFRDQPPGVSTAQALFDRREGAAHAVH